MSSSARIYRTRLAALLLCLIAAVFWVFPSAAYTRETGKTVRIGWYESPFNQTDQNGRRSGYAYEYQQKIAAYTGWRYEYVEGSWPELMQMLIDGEIDLMADISYTVSRSRSILYSMLPMGVEEYYLCISTQGSSGINSRDYSSLNGKKSASTRGASRRRCSAAGPQKKGYRLTLWK